MRRRTSSDSSSFSTSPPSSLTSHTHYKAHARSRSRQAEVEPAVIGGIGKLVRLVVVAAVLAFVVPYIRGVLFGGSNNALVNGANAKIGNVSKGVRGAVKGAKSVIAEVAEEMEDVVDVFNFKHDDYLPSAAKRGRDKIKDVAGTSPTAVIQKAASQKQQLKQAANSQSRSSRHCNNNDDDQDSQYHGHQANSQSSSNSNFISTILSILSSLYSLSLTLLYFASIPFRFLFSLLFSLLTSIYSYCRLALSHTLRPIVTLLAPLTYLLSGFFYVFIQTPARLVGAIVTELYPVYIFLGAAAVVGISMGVVAAGVLYITAFVFVDRVPKQQQARLVEVKGKGKMREEDVFDGPGWVGGSGESSPDQTEREAEAWQRARRQAYGSPQYSYHSQQSSSEAREGYFATNPTNYSSASPLFSPITPYRTGRGGESSKGSYSSYSAPPSSSLRASVA